MKFFLTISALLLPILGFAQLDSGSIKKAEFFILNDHINRIAMPNIERLCEMGKRTKFRDSTNLKRCTIKTKDFNALEKLLVCTMKNRACSFVEQVVCVINIQLKEPRNDGTNQMSFGLTCSGYLLFENRQFELSSELINLLRPYAPYYFNSLNQSFWDGVKGR